MSKDVEATAKLQEKLKHFDAAIMVFVNHDKAIQALSLSRKYEKQGIKLREENRVAQLARGFAKQLAQEENYSLLSEVAKYFETVDDQVHYLKVARKWDEVCQILDANEKYNELCEIYNMLGLCLEGLKLAQRINSKEWEAIFAFQIANAEISSNESITNQDILRILETYCDSVACPTDKKARALLLLGRSKQDCTLCERALSMHWNNPAGYVEAFNLVTKFKESISPNSVISVCEKLSKVLKVVDQFMNQTDTESEKRSPNYNDSLILSLTESFYGIKRVQISEIDSDKLQYELSANWQQHIWIPFVSPDLDLEGETVLTLDRECIFGKIKTHLEQYLQKWRSEDQFHVSENLLSKLASSRYPFHTSLAECKELYFHEQKSLLTFSAKKLHNYLDVCILCHKAREFGSGQLLRLDIPKLLLTFISPKVTTYADITRGHMERIIRNFRKSIQQITETIVSKENIQFNVDEWLDAWRIYSIMGIDIESKHKRSLQSHPDEYVYNNTRKVHNHIFTMWSLSCRLMQHRKVVQASKIVLRYVLKPIIENDEIRCTFSTVNLVNILSIHTSALLFLLNYCKVSLRQGPTMIVPHSFMHVLRTFENINRQGQTKTSLLENSILGINLVLVDDVVKLQEEIIQILWNFFDILLGFYDKRFLPLWNSVTTEECLKRGEARECLILTLTLFANLAQTRVDQIHLNIYQLTILRAFHRFKVNDDSEALKEAHDLFAKSANVTGTFIAIKSLITSVKQHDFLVTIDPQPRFYKNYDFLECKYYPQVSLIPPKDLERVQSINVKQQVFEVTPEPQSESHSNTYIPKPKPLNPNATEFKPRLDPNAPEFKFNPVIVATQKFERMSSYVDEEMEEVLQTAGVKKQISVEMVTSVAEDTSLMEPTFCKACNVRLNPTKEDTGDNYRASNSNVEGFSAHSKSQGHKDNCELYYRFTKECTDYEDHKKKLKEVMQKCQTFIEQHTHFTALSSELRLAIKDQFEKGDKVVRETGLNGKWREGITATKSIVEKLVSLIIKTEAHIRSEFEKEQQLAEEREVEEIREEFDDKEMEKRMQPKTRHKKK